MVRFKYQKWVDSGLILDPFVTGFTKSEWLVGIHLVMNDFVNQITRFLEAQARPNSTDPMTKNKKKKQ